jgi:hypothetical protein
MGKAQVGKFKFILGRTVITPEAGDVVNVMGAADLLRRHMTLDRGELCEADHLANEHAAENGERVLSSFKHNGIEVWVVTEHDRSVTTIMLPEEY